MFSSRCFSERATFLTGARRLRIAQSYHPWKIPTVPENFTGRLHGLAGQQHIDRQSPHEKSETSMLPGPRNACLHDAVLETLHAGDAGDQTRLELTGIEMPSGPFGRVVLTRTPTPLGSTSETDQGHRGTPRPPQPSRDNLSA